MSIMRSLGPRLRFSAPAAGVVLAVSCVVIGGALFLQAWKGIPTTSLARDPATVAKLPFYTGALSNLGVLGWFAAAVMCLFSAAVLPAGRSIGVGRGFLLAAGLFTLFLALDDLFMFHEAVFPKILGVPERLVFAGYAVAAVACVVSFRRTILETDYPLLGFALILLGVAAMVEFIPGSDPFILEHGAKFAGIVAWLVYFTRVSASALRSALSK